MATVTAADPRPARTRPDPTRRVWQVPVFLLGLGAFLAVYTGTIPLGPPDPAAAFRKDVAALRAAAEKLPADPTEIKGLVARTAAALGAYPELAPAAHFALGGAYVRLAETAATPADAKNHWILAKQHFDDIRPAQLTDPADPPRLAYRAAKAKAAVLPPTTTPAEIEATRDLLTRTPANEDPGDAPRLVAELCLRTVPPDAKKAKEALTAYIADAGQATPPAAVERAKLRLSEIYLQLGDADGAKAWLGRIGRDAPGDVLPTAKAQLARIRMAEGDFAGAAREWELLRGLADMPAEVRGAAAYHLGICRVTAKPPDPAAAAALFDEAVKVDGPEAPAAAVRLADLNLRNPDPAAHAAAAGLLAAAVKGVSAPADYRGTLLPLAEVQATFELAVQTFVTDGAFESAVAVADTYKAVAVGDRDRERKAAALAAWGEAIKKSGGDAKPKFTAAAEEYVALAAARTVETDKAEQLRRAAALHRQAGDATASLSTLEQAIKLPKLPDDALGPVWIEYAEGLLLANRPDEALTVFKKAMATEGPTSTLARHRLARLLLDSRDPKKMPLGIELLSQIAHAERVEPAEQDAHERALVELAHEYIRAGNFAEAESRLRTQLQRYPTGPEAGLGKLLLGVSLLQRADPRAKPAAPDPVKARDEALKLFKELSAEIETRRKTGRSVERDAWLRTQAALRILQTYQQMAKPYDVLTAADPLRQEFSGTADELIVLSLMYHAYKQLDKPEGALTIRDQMRDVYAKLKDKPGAFWAKEGEYSRTYWETVWFAPDGKK